jgi:hypothetical protein
MDVGTGLAILGGGELSKDMLGKMLGPTAEYLGEGMQQWTERRMNNVRRVFSKAERKLGDGIERPGAIPPRVLKTVLEEGQFADDEVVAEYLGGVLASSRTESGRDDRAASMGHVIASLSTYALRTHYVFYAAARRHEVGGDPARWRTGRGYLDPQVFISTQDYTRAMDFTGDEAESLMGIVTDTMLSLTRADLIHHWVVGSTEHLRANVANVHFPGQGVVLSLSQYGVALFCAAHGIRGDPFDAFVDEGTRFEIEGGPYVPEGPLVSELAPYEAPPTIEGHVTSG